LDAEYCREPDWWRAGEDEPDITVTRKWTHSQPRGATLEAKFNALTDAWLSDTFGDSSLTRMTSNINYLSIIALGQKVVPLILRRLQIAPEPWFVALMALTGERSIGLQYSGNFNKIANAWLEWGRSRGLL